MLFHQTMTLSESGSRVNKYCRKDSLPEINISDR